MDHVLEGTRLPGQVSKTGADEAHEGFFPLGSKGTNPHYMSGFAFQLEGQDLSPKGLNVNKNAILQKRIQLGRKCNPTYRTQTDASETVLECGFKDTGPALKDVSGGMSQGSVLRLLIYHF